MIKFIKDTLQTNGKWSLKRCLAVLFSHYVIVYTYTPSWNSAFEVLEFVVASILMFVATLLGLNEYAKRLQLKNKSEE